MRELWVDDCKPAPGGMPVARTYDDALHMLRRFDWDLVYLDHDLGEDHRTGYDLLKQIIADGRAPANADEACSRYACREDIFS